ncbi:MAG: hypothetical protein U9R75_12020 [Candidatus Thermoplasmatota archaeon]|nr:hypothetical protein [Candidatus Thermoplasmatota archaeon]
MQERVRSGVRRAPPRHTAKASVKAPPVPRRKISTAARMFYLMRWGYHFVTPIGMIIIIWGIIEAQYGRPEVAWPIIIGGGLFTYLANYFNKAR